jgi:hypothetical protein
VSLTGPIRKMSTALASPVLYTLNVGEDELPMNDQLGKTLRIEFVGKITCMACGRSIKKSFSQGYCYPCFRDLPETDGCIVRPETCHFAAGTCRDPAWGEANCMQLHTVYLANSSALKVGITRGTHPVSRWIDQGAFEGLAIRLAKNRLESGQIEVGLKEFVSDRTNWRTMLKGEPEALDLAARRDELLARYNELHPDTPLAGEAIPDAKAIQIQYPVSEYPEKIKSHNLEKEAVLEGTLMGIKGQYLILDTAVINMRKYGGYHLQVG